MKRLHIALFLGFVFMSSCVLTEEEKKTQENVELSTDLWITRCLKFSHKFQVTLR